MIVSSVVKLVAVWCDLGNIVYFCRSVADNILLILWFDSLLTLIAYCVLPSQI